MADSVKKSISLDNITWKPKYGNFTFGPVSVSEDPGKFIALIGPNGAGKTTLLKIIAGVLQNKTGTVRLNGENPAGWSPLIRGKRLAYLSQEPEKPFGFPLWEYVTLGRFPYTGAFRSPDNYDLKGVEKEIELWGLSSLFSQPVSTLSGGEFQRVRLARAFSQEPDFLVMDEPGNHLDLGSRIKILRRLKNEARSGKTILVVLHDINDALIFADTIWLFSEGKLIADGSPEKVLKEDNLKEIYGLELNRFVSSEGYSMFGVNR
jgi:iron complex transport system ATP-binding protein